MKDDQTNKLPGTQGSGSPPSDDRIDFIVSAVQSLAVSMETVKEDIKELKIGLQDAVSRIAKLEQTAQERALDTKPIWERALAEIASLRFELVEIKSDIKAIKDDITEIKADITVIKAEQAEMKLDILLIKSELTDTKNAMQDGFVLLSDKFGEINDDMVNLRVNQKWLRRKLEGLSPKTQ